MGFLKDSLGTILGIASSIAAVVLPINPVAAFALAFAGNFAGAKLNERAANSQLRRMRQQGQQFNVRSNVEPVPVIYGEVDEMGGAIVFQATHGHKDQPTIEDSTEYLTMVIVWCEGEIGGVQALYLNDFASTQSRFTGLVEQAHYTGADAQTADTYLVDTCASTANPTLASKWTVDHRLRGVAYSRVTMKYSPGAYGQDGIPTVLAKVRGRKCYDPRTGLTAWTQNPALHALDYMRNTRFGMAIPDSEIDFGSFSLGASFCDESVAGLANRDDRYHSNIVVDPTDDPQQVIGEILSSCRGDVVYSGGVYRLVVDRPTWPSFPLVENMCVGEWSMQLDALGVRLNRVRASFINIAKGNQPDFVIVEDADYRVTDGAELLESEISLPGVTENGQATDLATWELRASRYGLVVEVATTLAGLSCEVGDVIQFTHSTPGWTDKLFRVVAITITQEDDVRLTLREYSDTVYSAQTANADIPPGTSLPDPMDVVEPTALGLSTTLLRATDGLGYLYGLTATWSQVTTNYVVGHQIEWRRTAESAWTHAVINRPDLGTYAITGLQFDTSYTVRVRAVNSIGAVSDWVTATATTLPEAVQIPDDALFSNLIVDPGITDQSNWNLSNATWSPSDGPGGTPCIRFPAVGGTQIALEIRRPLSNQTITETGNQYQFWITVRRNSGSGVLNVGWQVYNIYGTSRLTAAAGVDLTSLTVGVWRTLGPYTSAVFNDPLINADPSENQPPHRVNVSMAIFSGNASFDVADVYAMRVPQ